MCEIKTALELMAPELNTLQTLMSRNFIPGTPNDQIRAVLETEIMNLDFIAIFKPEIYECDPRTIRHHMRRVITQNLSFNPDLNLVYVTTRNMEVGANKIKTKVLEVSPTVNGEISLCRQAGVLLRVNQPKVEYDETTKLVKSVTVELVVPVYDA